MSIRGREDRLLHHVQLADLWKAVSHVSEEGPGLATKKRARQKKLAADAELEASTSSRGTRGRQQRDELYSPVYQTCAEAFIPPRAGWLERKY